MSVTTTPILKTPEQQFCLKEQCKTNISDPVKFPSIQCAKCEKFMCLGCAGKPSNIADKTFLAIVKKDQIHVICDGCRNAPPVPDLTNTLVTLMSKFEAVTENLNKVTENLAAITERIDKFESRMDDLEKRANQTGNFTDVMQAVEEHAKRQEKKNNVVIHFLPDGANFNDNQNLDGGCGDLVGTDLEKVAKLVEATNGDPNSIVKVFRMGAARDDAKPRPLKVVCNNHWTKRGLITGQKRLQQKFPILAQSKMFVRDDLTDLQREEDRKLREQLKNLREDNPDKDLVIRNMKICVRSGKSIVPFL